MASGNGMGLKTMMMQQLSNEHKISMPDEISRSLEPMIRPERAFEPKKEEASTRVPDINENGDDPFKFPLHKKGVRISSGYGLREDPLTKAERFHHGIDIAASKGSPIYPAARGEVIFSGEKGGYGNVVEVLHDNGVVTRYGHNSKNLVKKGDKVSPGDPIAYVGSTGRSTGPHVHFEVIKNGEAVDPEKITYG
ncbi:MAG: M23 family metallopeptidase [Deltaproteobacteria bacterium]|nr:M23 family metallopeptidase [Deltaproteobacteria bacterium]